MKPEIQVEFCVTGLNISPDEITHLIGITPTKTWNYGESIQKTLLRRKHNGWCLSTKTNDISLGEPTRNLLNVLLPKTKIINKLCTEYKLNCELSCAIYIIDETPVINFSPDVISHLALLNTAIDIDIILTK